MPLIYVRNSVKMKSKGGGRLVWLDSTEPGCMLAHYATPEPYIFPRAKEPGFFKTACTKRPLFFMKSTSLLFCVWAFNSLVVHTWGNPGPNTTVYLDAYGWTVVLPSEDSRIVYVSSSQGDDANDGLSPETPKQSLSAANALIRDGYPDHLLLKRGDVFDQRSERSALPGGWKSGRSADEPILLSYYGESGARPQVLINRSLFDHGGRNRDYQAIIGIEAYRIGSDPDSTEFDNERSYQSVRMVGGGRDILIEDCVFRFAETIVQSYGGHVYRDFRFRRNIVLDVWAHDTSTHNNPRPSGIYMSGVEGSYLFEENVFDHNGWNTRIPGAGANMYNHNVYLQYSNVAGGIIRGNISTRASAHGWHGRSGGVMERNLFAANAVSANLGGMAAPADPDVMSFDNRFVENVILDGRRMDPDDSSWPRTTAVWGFVGAFIGEIEVRDNIIANRRDSGTARALHTAEQPASLNLINNIVYNWEATHDTFDPDWPHPDAGLGDYMASIGGAASADAFYQWQRNRPLRTLPWEMTAYAAINYFRSGFLQPPVEGYYQYTSSPTPPPDSPSPTPTVEPEEPEAGTPIETPTETPVEDSVETPTETETDVPHEWPVENEDLWHHTGTWLGWLWTGHLPWVYSLDFYGYIYLPAQDLDPVDGGWIYVPRY